jgi:hypothetical protein
LSPKEEKSCEREGKRNVSRHAETQGNENTNGPNLILPDDELAGGNDFRASWTFPTSWAYRGAHYLSDLLLDVISIT